MRKWTTSESQIEVLVALLHHFSRLGYDLLQVLHPQRLGRKNPKGLVEAIRRCGLYNHDEAKRLLLASPRQRRRRATPPAPPPPRLL